MRIGVGSEAGVGTWLQLGVQRLADVRDDGEEQQRGAFQHFLRQRAARSRSSSITVTLAPAASSGSVVRGLVIQRFTQDGIDIADSNNNVVAGKKTLAESGLKIESADSMADAAKKIVKLVA